MEWLRADLSSNPTLCTLAYWHHPRFSSAHGAGSVATLEPIWEVLYEADADVVISGHAHTYERFAPQTPAGVADPARGIRQFIVGTGGRDLFRFAEAVPNSEVRINRTFGVLGLLLYPDGYMWEFISVGNLRTLDKGGEYCH